MTKLKQIVTRESLKQSIETHPKGPGHVIGRALVAIFRLQTEEEKQENHTKFRNGMGFSANDGRIGALGAKTFMKHGTLEEWQFKPWIKPDKNGYPRIVKYVKQLNWIANEKEKAQTQTQA